MICWLELSDTTPKSASPGANPAKGLAMVKRKLTTVFCADVQQCGRMTAADEAATLARLGGLLHRFQDWYATLDRRARLSVAMIGFFLAINLLFTGIATPWFIFPSLPFAIHLFT